MNTIMNIDALQIKNLNKSYEEVDALKDISFSIPQGRIFGLLGPNGAGKTTLLRIVNHILSRDSGEVLIFGEPVSFNTSRKIGYLPEERGLYESMTVEKQIFYFGELKGKTKREIQPLMDEFLQLFNISDFKKRKIKELSKGNQQKVQIIASLVHNPDLIIFDEPLSGFDPINGILFLDLITMLKSRGKTIIISSHNMHSVEEICDSVIIINKGKIVLNNTIQAIKRQFSTDEYLITLNAKIDRNHPNLSALIKELVEIQIPIPSVEGDADSLAYQYQFIKIDNSVKNSEVIAAFASMADIVSFSKRVPTLAEIFVACVGE